MSTSPAIRKPLQERSRATWAKVLNAGVDLLETDGYSGLTIDAICVRAGATPSSIYARAGNKEGLLLAIYEHAQKRINSVAIDPSDPVWDGLAPAEVVRQAVAVVSRVWLDNASLLRPIVHRAGDDPEIFRRGSESSRALAADYRAVLARAGIRKRDADVTYRLVYAALVERVMYGEDFESDVSMPDRKFKRVLGDVAVRYLQLGDGDR